jgi:hypothetical protein
VEPLTTARLAVRSMFMSKSFHVLVTRRSDDRRAAIRPVIVVALVTRSR